MRAPRILYMGYGDIGRRCLRDLVTEGFDVIGVFCRAADRGQLAPAHSVHSLAHELALPCFAATDPSDPEFLRQAGAKAPQILLSVQYDRILKPALLAIPIHGAYNLHFGPLPRLRGCFPTKWAIINDEPAGVTFHCIDPGVDSGAIIAQEIVALAPDETDESLYHRLQEVGYGIFRRQLEWMKALAPPPPQPQDSAHASYYSKRVPHDGIVDWSRDARWLERFIRAFTFLPHPGARAIVLGHEIEIIAPTRVVARPEGADHGAAAAADGGLIVACGRDALQIERVKVGGKIYSATDWLLETAASAAK